MGDVEDFRKKLIRQLQGAFSGELAAGHAYQGHADSVRRADEKARIAAEYALNSGHAELVECLLHMAEVEWEHERYFRSKVESHWLRHVIPVWPGLPPKESIRRRYASLSQPLAVQRSVRVETAPDAA